MPRKRLVFERILVAKSLKEGRQTDRRNKWETQRNLLEYEKQAYFHFSRFIDYLSKSKPLHVLDIGAGKMVALSEIKTRFPGRDLHVTGLTLARLPEHSEAKSKGIGVRIGRIETKKFDRQFDLITSIRCLEYSEEISRAVSSATNLLNQEGVAVLIVNAFALANSDALEILRKKGVQFKVWKGNVLIIQKTTDKQAFKKFISPFLWDDPYTIGIY